MLMKTSIYLTSSLASLLNHLSPCGMKNVKNQLKPVCTAHTIHSQTKALFARDKYYQGTPCDLKISSMFVFYTVHS